MTAAELMQPRYEVIAEYPSCHHELGSIVDNVTEYSEAFFNKYPHLFRKLNWWEYRKAEDMPKKLICKADHFGQDVYEIEEWDMPFMIGWVNKLEGTGCDIRLYVPECGYFPVD